MPSIQARVVAPLHFNRTLYGASGISGKRIFLPKVHSKIFRFVSAACKSLAWVEMNTFKPQILHETFFSYHTYAYGRAKKVLTVYDMITERYPEYFGSSHVSTGPKKAAVMRADHVICISENTRRDLIELFDVPESKTSVVHLAAEEEFFEANYEESEADVLNVPFVLFVGGRGGYKNFTRFLQAFSSSSFLKNNFSIVCFGGGILTDMEKNLAVSFGLRPDQLLQKSGGDYILAAYYRQAAALVYPSLYEGFGIPLIEAMACYCPVICSNTSSLPEVAGGACEYFDPTNVEDISAAMERVLQFSDRRAELITLGKVQCAKFSWQKCAEETVAIYRSLL